MSNLKVVHISKTKSPITDTKAWSKLLVEKWTRKDKEKAKKFYEQHKDFIDKKREQK